MFSFLSRFYSKKWRTPRFLCNMHLAVLLFVYLSASSLARGADQAQSENAGTIVRKSAVGPTKISFNRQYLVDYFTSCGYDRSEAVQAINSLSDEDVQKLIDHPEIVKKTGVIFVAAAILLIMLIVMILALISAHSQQQKILQEMKNQHKNKQPEGKKAIFKKYVKSYPPGCVQCPECLGKKFLYNVEGASGEALICPKCHGKGYVYKSDTEISAIYIISSTAVFSVVDRYGVISEKSLSLEEYVGNGGGHVEEFSPNKTVDWDESGNGTSQSETADYFQETYDIELK